MFGRSRKTITVQDYKDAFALMKQNERQAEELIILRISKERYKARVDTLAKEINYLKNKNENLMLDKNKQKKELSELMDKICTNGALDLFKFAEHFNLRVEKEKAEKEKQESYQPSFIICDEKELDSMHYFLDAKRDEAYKQGWDLRVPSKIELLERIEAMEKLIEDLEKIIENIELESKIESLQNENKKLKDNQAEAASKKEYTFNPDDLMYEIKINTIKSLTDENEELKEDARNYGLPLINQNKYLNSKIESLKKENENLKRQIDSLRDPSHKYFDFLNDEYRNKWFDLKKENKELKEKISSIASISIQAEGQFQFLMAQNEQQKIELVNQSNNFNREESILKANISRLEYTNKEYFKKIQILTSILTCPSPQHACTCGY